MQAEIISVGTELLMGQVVNSNAAMLAHKLLSLGVGCYYQQTVGDNELRLIESLTIASRRSDLIILTGGLGATEDDLTKQVLAKFLKQELVLDQVQWDYIQEYFQEQGRSVSSQDHKQALYLKDGQVFRTKQGLACGCYYQDPATSTAYLCLPGPPSELSAMLDQGVLPFLRETYLGNQQIESLYLNFVGIGEAELADIIQEEVRNQTQPTIAIYAKPRHIRLRLTVSGLDLSDLKQTNQKLADKLIKKLKAYYIGSGQDWTLEAYLIERLAAHNQSLSLAESLTAGGVMARLASVAGASAVLKGGQVVYQEATKAHPLGIDPAILENQGVYSKECACAMAQRSLSIYQSDFALALTGVAGPGEDQGHPAGQVFIACASKDGIVTWKELQIPARSRQYVRELASSHSLELLKNTIEQKFAKSLSSTQ